jgi:hypothetical protein
MIPTMLARITSSYVRLLLVVEGLLFVALVVLHVGMFFLGVDPRFERYTHDLFVAGVLVGICAVAFVENSLKWMAQIKRCPKWMWRTALGTGIYAMSLVLVLWIVSHHSPVNPIAFSAYGAAFAAISFCLLFPVVAREMFDHSQVVERSRNSLIIICISILMWWVWPYWR